MKLRSLIVVLIVALMANSAFAVYYWEVDSAATPFVGDWSDVNWWKATNSTDPDGGNAPQFHAPDGDQELQIYGAAGQAKPVVTVNNSNVYTCWYSNRSRIFGGAQVNIVPGGTLQGIGWLRVGEGSQANEGTVSALIQTGGAFIMENGSTPDYKDPAGLTISDGGSGSDCEGLYHISGGTITYLQPEAKDGGHIRIGDRGGLGTMRITGTAPVIQVGHLEMGGRAGKTDLSRVSEATLMYDVVAGGVSAMVVDSLGVGDSVNLHTYAESTTHLVVNLTEALADKDAEIILIDNVGSDAVVGKFDTFNGGYAYEGVFCDIGMGVIRQLTYVGGDGNDVALLVPEPATLALLSLGMFVIRRKK